MTADVLDILFDRDSLLTERESVFVGEILVDPSKNVSRGGRWLSSDHPDVRRAAADVSERGLLEPVGLRVLETPVLRPCGGKICCSDEAMARSTAPEHLAEIRYGFVRYSALLFLGRQSLRLVQPNVEATLHVGVSDERMEEACLAENLVRSQPTDPEVARYLWALSRRQPYASMPPGEVVYELTKKFRFPSVSRVRSLLRVQSRCPDDLLLAWEARPTAEVLAALDLASRLDPENLLEEERRHSAMRQTYESELARALEREQESPARTDRDPVPRRTVKSRAAALLSGLDSASEVYDDRSRSGYRPMTDGEREVVRVTLRHLSGVGPEPVR